MARQVKEESEIECFSVMELGSKGTLYELMNNTKFEVDSTLQFSLFRDVTHVNGRVIVLHC